MLWINNTKYFRIPGKYLSYQVQDINNLKHNEYVFYVISTSPSTYVRAVIKRNRTDIYVIYKTNSLKYVSKINQRHSYIIYRIYNMIVYADNKVADFSRIKPITSDSKYIYYDYNILSPDIKRQLNPKKCIKHNY